MISKTRSLVNDVYMDRQVALLTQHGKEQVIVPALERALGCQVNHVAGYDTDRLGTFTRDISRTGTQLEAARRKARIGMDMTGCRLGVASEGIFGPDPYCGMFSLNQELVIWIDDALAIEIVGMATGATNFGHLLTSDWVLAEAFARTAGFPDHHLVVRPQDESDQRIRKDIMSWQTLQKAFCWARAQASNGQVFLETDGRANCNPTRMQVIRRAVEDLARKLCTPCPVCNVPGFHLADTVPGLPCESCGSSTREVQADIYRCVKCGHQRTVERREKIAMAGRCDICNP